MKRVVITGMGSINPLGHSVETTWKALVNKECGIDEISHYDTANRKVKLAAEVKNYEETDYFSKKEAKHLDRFLQFAHIAAKEALIDSAYVPLSNPYRIGTIISSGIGGLETIVNENDRVAGENNYDRVTPYFIPMAITNMAAGDVARLFKAKGISESISTACASATNAIGRGFLLIRSGEMDMMVVGGAEATITPLGIGGFTAIKALSQESDPKRASIPFDKARNGFVMGEGAAILVLEEYEHAKVRGAKIYAEITGFASTCDAYHITAPDPSGEAGIKALEMALEMAKLQPEEIDYINAHGTSTPLNDSAECMIYSHVFRGNKRPLLGSTKANLGHLLGAAGAVEAMITSLSLFHNTFVPQIGTLDLDEACTLELAGSEIRDINHAISNNLGFGGHNATLVFSKVEEA